MVIKKLFGSIISFLILCTVFVPKVTVSAEDTVVQSEDITIELSNYDFKIGKSFDTGSANISYSDNVSADWINTSTGVVDYAFDTSSVVIPDKDYVTSISFDMDIPAENMGISEGDSISVNGKGWTVSKLTTSEGVTGITVTDTYKIDGNDLFDIVLPDFDDMYYLENGSGTSIRRTVRITPKYDIYGVKNEQNNTYCYGSYNNTINKQNINLTKGTDYDLDIDTHVVKKGAAVSFHGRWYIGDDEYTLFNIDFDTEMYGPDIYIKDGSSWVNNLSYKYKNVSIEHGQSDQYRISKTIKNRGNYPASNVRIEFSDNNRGYFTVEGLDSVTLQPDEEISFDIVVDKDLPVGVYEDSFTIKYDGIFEDKTYPESTKTSWISLDLYKYYPIEISLLEKLDGSELSGGVFRIRDGSYNILETFTTTSEPKQITLRNNTYFTIIQDKAPDGYVMRYPQYEFRVNDNGTVSAELRSPSDNLGSTDTDLGDNKIRIFNDRKSDKYDITFFATSTRREEYAFRYLEGVDIELKNYDTSEIIDTWTSDDEGHIVESLPVGIYEISAKYPALNYDRTYRFELKYDGSMVHLLRGDTSVTERLYEDYFTKDKMNLGTTTDRWYVDEPYARISNRFFYLHILESIHDRSERRTLVRVIDGNTQEPIEGVNARVVKRNGEVVEDSWVTTSEPHVIIEPRDNWVRDVVVDIPEGYYGNSTYYIGWTREEVEGEYEQEILIRLFKKEDTAIRVNISCHGERFSNFRNREIPGAVFELYDYEDNLIETWESTDEPHAVYLLPDISIGSDNYPRYDYYIKEVQFPENCEPVYYRWPFTLDANGELDGSNARDYDTGEVLIYGKMSEMTETLNNNIIIRHNVLYEELDLFKKDALTGEFLNGGEFEVYYGSTSEGRLIGKYSAAKEGTKIKVPVNSVFTIVEKKAPDNYDGEAKITLRFDSTGKLAVIHNDGYWRYYENEEKIVLENNRVSQDILINKVDEKGNYVEGVQLSIYGEDGSLIHQLTTGSEPISIKLPVGKYVLKEIKTPKGYASIEEFPFEITEEGKIMTTKDDKNIIVEELTITVINKKKPDEPKYEIPKTGV